MFDLSPPTQSFSSHSILRYDKFIIQKMRMLKGMNDCGMKVLCESKSRALHSIDCTDPRMNVTRKSWMGKRVEFIFTV